MVDNKKATGIIANKRASMMMPIIIGVIVILCGLVVYLIWRYFHLKERLTLAEENAGQEL